MKWMFIQALTICARLDNYDAHVAINQGSFGEGEDSVRSTSIVSILNLKYYLPFFAKLGTLMWRSIVLSLSLQLVFLASNPLLDYKACWICATYLHLVA
jgi:hypothetical protein